MKVPRRDESVGRRAALALLASLALLAIAPSEASALPIIVYGSFERSPVGYVGCVSTTGFQKIYCFATYKIPEGNDAGKVKVVAKSKVAPGEVFVEELVAPEDALTSGTEPGGRATLHFESSLPRTGQVLIDLAAWAGPGWLESDNEGCVLYPAHYDFIAHEPALWGARTSRGTVAGEEVWEWSRCDGYFVGSTSGVWRMGV